MPEQPHTGISALKKRFRHADLLILRAVRKQRARAAMSQKGDVWGKFITDADVEELLVQHGEFGPIGFTDDLDVLIAQSRHALISHRTDALGLMAEVYGLHAIDLQLFLLALISELSSGYSRVFAYINDSVYQSYLSVDTAARLLTDHGESRLAVLQRLVYSKPLLHNELIDIVQVTYEYRGFAAQGIFVNPAVLQAILDTGLDDPVAFLSWLRERPDREGHG